MGVRILGLQKRNKPGKNGLLFGKFEIDRILSEGSFFLLKKQKSHTAVKSFDKTKETVTKIGKQC